MPAVLQSHILSASVAVRALLVMRAYFSEACSRGKITGKNPCLNRFIERRTTGVHAFKPERSLGLTESVYTKLSCTIIEHGFSCEPSCE